MKKLLLLLDTYLLPIMAGFLLVFIPLYPKIPLFDVLPGYIVRARLEDIFILLTVMVYGVYVLRRKAYFWNTPLTKPILIYLVIGAISLITAIIVIGTIPMQPIHISKAVFHFIRRIEYFSLFFIFFSVSSSMKRLKVYLILFLITIALITIYGYGQKYLYWCAFSTMNREFSKGWCLYLTDHARVMSTFGGHYDLAAFTMVALSILWSLFFSTKKLLSKIIFFVLLGASFWLIILTASRVSFLAYIASLTLVVFIWMYRNGLKWGITRWFTAISLSILVMLSFGDLSERFLHLLKLDERVGGIKTLLLKPLGAPPEKGIPLAMNQDELSMVTSKSDQPPTTTKPGSGSASNGLPSDVLDEQPDYTNIYTKEGKAISVRVKRTYSANALKFDLSTSIRLDYLWPKAWEGFLHDPLFGSGYSTLTKQNVTDFTEAESTDNGFLRSLGETGALGAIAFYAIIFTILLQMWWALPGIKNPFFYASVVGLGAATVGLLLNNVYIDIFEASKVALPFWSLSGIVLGTIASQKKEIEMQHTPMKLVIDWRGTVAFIKKFLTSDLFILAVILIVSFSLRMYRFDTPLADWHSWRQADTSSVTRNFIRSGMNFLYPTYDDLSSIASGKPNPQGLRLVEFPLYNAASTIVKKLFPEFNDHQSGRFTSILASLGSIVFLFLLMRKYTNRLTAFLTAIFFGIIPYNIYYSRVVLPEPTAVFAMLGMTYFFDRFLSFEDQLHDIKSKIKHGLIYIAALLFAISALLIKPPAGFYFLPLLYLVFRYKGLRGLFRPSIIVFFVLSIVPLLWWRWWVSHFPEGVPAYEWLLNGDGIRFKGAFFYWIFGDRIARLILGFWALPLLIMGILVRPKEKEGWFFYTWLISSLLYLFTFATGNVRHDYYQIFLIPTISVFLAKGAAVLVTLPKGEWNVWMGRVVCGVCMILSLSIGWYFVRDYFNINHPEIIEAAEAARSILKPKTLVVAPYGGDTAFLYQIDHPGWPIVEGKIEDMVKKGAHYYVSVQDDDATIYLLKEIQNPSYPNNFKILERSKTSTNQPYTIIQLVKNEQIPK